MAQIVKTVIVKNTGKTPIRISIKPTRRVSTYFNEDGGQVVLNPGKSIQVEEERVDPSHLRNLARLGSISTQVKSVEEEPEIPEVPEASLNLSFTYAIGGPATSMDPDDTITGLMPFEFTSSEIVVTNDGDLDANVTSATLSPASGASISGFGSSTIANGGTNSFDLSWGGAGAFDEDLTITINGEDYVFTFQGSVQGISD